MSLLAIARSTWRTSTIRSSHQLGIRFPHRDPRLIVRTPGTLQSAWLTSTSQRQSSWNSLVDEMQISRLKTAYPHIETPTPAQEALLKGLDGNKDIFLKDRMGRGKTFGLALSSIHMAKKGRRVMILVPTPQLLDLIQNHLDSLSTGTSLDTLSIWLTTPKNALSDIRLDKFSPDIIMIDEPETLLQPLPPRHLQGGALRTHPFYKHPPPLATLLNHLAQLGTNTNIRMVWVGAEMNGLLKRTIRHRGWAGLDALELDFEFDGRSSRPVKDMDSLAGSLAMEGPVGSGEVEHESYLVGSGGITPYVPGQAGRDPPPYRTGRPIIPDAMIQAVVQYQANHLPLDGTTTMILPPSGYPLDLLATRLTSHASKSKVPMSITNIIPTSTETEPNSILITPRSAVPGLDIPNLSRVILLDGLDLAGVSPAQRSRGGMKKRTAFYEVIRGRLGRLGSVTSEKGGQVVSFITEGSGEEVGLEAVIGPGS